MKKISEEMICPFGDDSVDFKIDNDIHNFYKKTADILEINIEFLDNEFVDKNTSESVDMISIYKCSESIKGANLV
jgi:hypothetical protein